MLDEGVHCCGKSVGSFLIAATGTCDFPGTRRQLLGLRDQQTHFTCCFALALHTSDERSKGLCQPKKDLPLG
jgi:hypothetical protein